MLKQGGNMAESRDEIIKIKESIKGRLSASIGTAHTEVKRLEKIDFAFSNLRLLTFLVVIFSIWLFIYQDEIAGVIAGINSIIAFACLIYYHNIILDKLRRTRAEKELACERKSRSEENIEGHKDAEKFFVKETIDHPIFNAAPLRAGEKNSYTVSAEILNDLDFYGGDANLFSLYNTAQTSVGVRKFYNFLKTPLLDAAAIDERRKAVMELSAHQAFVDSAMLELHELRGRRFSEFISAVNAPRILPHNILFRYLLMALSASGVITLLTGHYNAFVFIYIFNFAMIAAFFEKCSNIKKNYISISYFARTFSSLSEAFYRADFDCAILKELSSAFGGCKAFAAVKTGRPFYKKLSALAKIAELMLIPMPAILDAVILSELMLCERIERRTKEIAAELMSFIEALGELEALMSLANIKIDLPEYNFSAVKSGGPRTLKISGALHPLLKFENGVANSIDFNDELDIAIITGSNMSGKSTFLKSVAIAVILSQIGAPVRAEAMELTPFVILTDIRITDSIKAGVSHFYSELLRVKAVTDKLKTVTNVFAIFDELFHGTNSRERLALCRATLEYFRESGGKFVMATHDKELTSLGDGPDAPAMKNFHFEEKTEGLESFFTYKLIKGPATAANAVKLARRCGLPEQIYKRAEELTK